MPKTRTAAFVSYPDSPFGFPSSFVLGHSLSFLHNSELGLRNFSRRRATEYAWSMHRLSIQQRRPPKMNRRWLAVGVCICVAVLTWVVFGQTLRHDFINYDDPRYVYENTKITSGLNIAGIAWAFTHIHSENWHPLTTITHMLDCQLYGLKASGHHFTNVLLHTIAVLLLFVVLLQMTGALWRSAFVAAVFAVHPLHVESVAWVAERKDVLSGVFFML